MSKAYNTDGSINYSYWLDFVIRAIKESKTGTIIFPVAGPSDAVKIVNFLRNNKFNASIESKGYYSLIRLVKPVAPKDTPA